MLVKLIVIYILANGSPGVFISPAGTLVDCEKGLEMTPRHLAKTQRKFVSGVCVDVGNILTPKPRHKHKKRKVREFYV